MTAMALSLFLALSPMSADGVPRNPERGCSRQWPATIRVFMIHKRGSSTPARIVTMDMDHYTGAVLASGAAPAHKPMEALKAMAVVVAARAHWFKCHPQRGYSWHGKAYDIHSGTARRGIQGWADAGQYLQPGVYVHSRIRRAVRDVHGTLLRRGTRMAKPQWSGTNGRCGYGVTGNRLVDSATDCARRGWPWKRILRLYLPKVEVVR